MELEEYLLILTFNLHMNIFKRSLQFLFLILIFSCSGSKKNFDISLKDKFDSGMSNLEKGKYLQAQVDFNDVLLRGTGSELGDDAQYFLGEAYYQNNEYLDAITEFEKLTRRMGFSEYVEKARFKICEAYKIESPKYYHDQEYTVKALERYQEFMDDYPNSEYTELIILSIEELRNKLAEKLYQTGILYIKMEEFESAKIAFNEAINKYYDTDIIHKLYQGLIITLSKNLEVEKAYKILKKHESSLKQFNLYSDALSSIDIGKSKLKKGEK